MNKKDELQSRLSDIASKIGLYRGLVEHAGWAALVAAAKEQREARLLVLGEPSTSLGNVLNQEFMKGEASGIGLVMKFPEIQLELLKSEMKLLETAVIMEEENAIQAEVSAAKPGRVDNDRDWYGGAELAATGERFKP